MCGRYALTISRETFASFFRAQAPAGMTHRFNLAPTQEAPVIVRREGGGRETVMMRWGLIPSWAKDATIGSRLINARCETLADKSSFREAFRRRRCIIPLSGFYEWRQSGRQKQPYYITRVDGNPMTVAGLWESWTDPASGEEVRTFVIITTQASSQMRPLHDRMPLVLEPEDVDRWLDPASDMELIVALLRPAAEGVLTMHPVSRRVNRPENDDPSLIQPAGSDEGSDENQTEPGLFGQ